MHLWLPAQKLVARNNSECYNKSYYSFESAGWLKWKSSKEPNLEAGFPGSQEWVLWATIWSHAAASFGFFITYQAATEEAIFWSGFKIQPLGDCPGLPRKKEITSKSYDQLILQAVAGW